MARMDKQIMDWPEIEPVLSYFDTHTGD